MDDSLPQDDSEILEQWKKVIDQEEIKNVHIEKIMQWTDHPKKERFINWKDDSIENGKTMLACAIWYGRLDIARLLLKKGADINCVNKFGTSAMMNATYRGHTSIVKLLLDMGADTSISNVVGDTALSFASNRGQTNMVELLLKNGADFTIANNDGETALICATCEGHFEIVKLLLDKGADCKNVKVGGKTPLGLASGRGYTEIVELLLAVLDDSETPVEWTRLFNEDRIMKVNIETIRQWMGHPKKDIFINWKNDSIMGGMTMLLYAMRNQRLDIAILLMEHGADVAIADNDGNTSLIYASLEGHNTIVELLLEKGADLNIANMHGITALMHAANEGHDTTVELLLEKGADSTITSNFGDTALKYAAQGGHTETADILLDKGVDINIADEHGDTALMHASTRGHSEMVKLLLTKGADCKIANCQGRTAFTQAYYLEHNNVVNMLLKKAPLKDIIHDVVKYPHLANKFLELYRENREIADWLDKDGRTVRQVACKECREAILFLGQYDLNDQPMHESSTCKIYSALDYGGRDEHNLEQPRRVAMKFMENKEHFLNEIRTRRNDDGSPRFSSQFVTPALVTFRADSHQEFAEACKAWKTSDIETDLLPDYCLVMPLGERSLLEAMNAENLSAKHKDLQRREILLTLCEIFSYLHGMGYVHGDVKPHNVVRHMGENVTWKAIDFDACTKIGDVVGLKLTTGSAPPEMLKIVKEADADSKPMVGSKVVLRQLGGGLDESDLVLADPSFDVWSYGILMYQLVTGRSFFHSDLQGDIDETGLQELANLTQTGIQKKLDSVGDVNARLLLSRILRLNPKERPTMSEVGQDYYFHPSESPQGRKAQFFGKQVFDDAPEENLFAVEAIQTSRAENVDEDDGSENMEEIEPFLSSKAEFSYFKLRDEDKDWNDKLLNSEVETFHFDKLGGMDEKPRLIDGDTIYRNEFLRVLLSNRGPDYFMGFLVEYFGLYKIMHDAHEVCQGIKANLVSDVKDLRGIFTKLFVRGKGLNDVVRGTLFCNSIDQFEYVGRQLKERYGHNVYIKPPKDETGAWPIPKLLIYGNKRVCGRCMSVEIQFSTVYMHLATHASNNHLVYEAIRESTGYLGDKDKDFQEFLQILNEQFIDTEGFLRNQSAQEGCFEIIEKQANENIGTGETHRQESGEHYTTKTTGFITSGRIICGGGQLFRFLPPTDRFQRFSESSFVVNKSLTLLSSHSYWSDESYDLEGKNVEFVVSFKGRGLAIAGIGTAKCLHGTTESNGGGARCSVHVGRSKFVVRKSGDQEVFREKKLPDQERATISFKMEDGVLSVSFVGSERAGKVEIGSVQVSMPSDQRYYLYMRAPPGVHDVKFHDIHITGGLVYWV